MPKNIYRVQGDEQPGKALHVTIPREIAQRHGIHKHTEVEIRDCDEIDEKGRVVNVMKVVKVGQVGEPPAHIEHVNTDEMYSGRKGHGISFAALQEAQLIFQQGSDGK